MLPNSSSWSVKQYSTTVPIRSTKIIKVSPSLTYNCKNSKIWVRKQFLKLSPVKIFGIQGDMLAQSLSAKTQIWKALSITQQESDKRNEASRSISKLRPKHLSIFGEDQPWIEVSESSLHTYSAQSKSKENSHLSSFKEL